MTEKSKPKCPCHAMAEAQIEELQKALEEHKWYESEREGHDIGCVDAQRSFITSMMPNWAEDFREKFCKGCEKY